VADVDDLRPLVDGVEERGEVVAVVAERNATDLRAELLRVDHVARERRPAAHDCVAGVERRLREAVDDPVGAGPERDLFEADPVPLRERLAQSVRASVRVAVELRRPARDRLERGREGRERPLVRRELDHALEAELALDLLDRLPRLVRDEAADGAPKEAVVGHAETLAAGYAV